MSKSQLRYLKWKNIFSSSWNSVRNPEFEKVDFKPYHLTSKRSVFNLKYFFANSLNPTNKLNTFFYKKYYDNLYDNDFEDKLQELFEYKDKSIYFTASLVSRDITELNSVDNYKENFPYTVSYIKYS